MDFVSIATGVVSIVSPFLPHLISLGSEVGGKIKDAVLDKGVDELGKQAKALWDKITGSFGDDRVLNSAATMTADSPEDTDRQRQLIEVLAKRLTEHPKLAEELVTIMGGQKRVQELTGGYGAIIERVRLKMRGAGEQKMKVGDRGRISDIDMEQ